MSFDLTTIYFNETNEKKMKMQFDVGFTKEKFPFLSSLGWSFLEPPEIDISVKAGGLVEV